MNLQEALLQTAKLLRAGRFSLTTAAGTTATLIDTTLVEPDGFFNNGTIFFLTGALAGKSAVITSWALATNTFTIPTQTAAPGSGVRYAVFDAKFTREALVAAVNNALAEIGPFPETYQNAALVVVSGQEQYDLPAGVSNILRVEIATNDADPYAWKIHRNWREQGDILEFEANIPAVDDKLIRLWYNKPHAEVSADADAISGAQIESLAWMAAYYALHNRSGLAENSEPETRELVAVAQEMARQALIKHPPKKMRPDSRYSGW